jgi:DNA topoisomerase-1
MDLRKLKTLIELVESSGITELEVTEGEEKIDPREVCGIALGKDSTGRDVEVRIGRYGPFLSNGEGRASIPDTAAFDELTTERAEAILAEAAKGPESLGVDPTSNLPVYLKKGRFGPYIQLGEMVEGGDKPKMASLLPGISPDAVTLDIALQLLAFPKLLGTNPENSTEVLVANGRFGPYVKCGAESRSIPADESPLTLTFERALELLKQPRARGRAASQPKVLKEVGKHPESGAAIQIKSGRYGPYVTDGTTNASLPQGSDPEALTLEEALSLIKARADKGPPTKGRRGKRKAVPKKEASEDTPKKKTTRSPRGKKAKASGA